MRRTTGDVIGRNKAEFGPSSFSTQLVGIA
jgi:hypothetical protein